MSEIQYVMYCVFSKEAIKAMGGNRGKLTSMAGHAYLHAWWDAEQKGWENRYKEVSPAINYRNSGLAKKVTLCVETTKDLEDLRTDIEIDQQLGNKYGFTYVVDAGLTVFEGPTAVCIGLGPFHRDRVPERLKSLRVLI